MHSMTAVTSGVAALLTALPIAIIAAPAVGQDTLDAPVGELKLLQIDSGPLPNAEARSAVMYDQIVRVDGAAWLRLEFGEVELSPGSYVRVTSLLDGEKQVLDAQTMAMWSNASAFFNGDSVRVEIVAAPNAPFNQMTIDQVLFETGQVGGALGGADAGGAGHQGANEGGIAGEPDCGICDGDDRVLSSATWSGRLIPAGCTASIWNEESCLVTAGHCVGGNNSVGFNVPLSVNCSVVQPPIADQFPITSVDFQNLGPGADWAVMTTGTNNLGETIYDRYNDFRPIAASLAPIGSTFTVFGYGFDSDPGDGASCYAQQTSSGTVNGLTSTYYTHDCDTTFGNSGSGILRGGAIAAIATHCGCPNNVGTRVDLNAFEAAREAMCDFAPANDDCAFGPLILAGSLGYTTIDANTDGFDESGSCGVTPQIDVWYRLLVQCDGEVTITISGTDFNAATTAYITSGCPTGPDQADECLTGEGTMTMQLTGGQQVRIRLGSSDGSEGTGTLTIDCTPTGCPEDCAAGGDGNVDVIDLLELLSQWGGPGSCDVDGSGTVDVNDLLDLLAAWGIPC